jgi:heptosyltransferase-2
MASSVQRILALLPNWVGDAVMFTPALRAVRRRHPEAELTCLGRPAPAATLTPNPFGGRTIASAGRIVADGLPLRLRRFDLAVLGPNSFRSGLFAWAAGARRRVGYRRDGRSLLLTQTLDPPRDAAGEFAVVPAIDYYLALADAAGCPPAGKEMELAVAEADAARAEQLLARAGRESGRPLVLLNPGASFGGAKIYPAGRFASVADRLIDEFGAQVVLNAAPAERPIAQAVEKGMNRVPLLNLAAVDNTLGLLKALVRRSALMVTNDTGPRHFAAAFGVPVVTIFGATDPDWTTIYYGRERIVRADVPCGPCQRKECPLPEGPERHRCMLEIEPETVFAACVDLLKENRTQ